MTRMESIDMFIKQSKNTKERLLYSGIQLFSLKGYSNVGIRQLCQSVGIKESSFYNHFKSKESFFREIMGLMVSKGDQVLFTDEEADLVVMESFINPVAYELAENNIYDNVRNTTIKILKGELYED